MKSFVRHGERRAEESTLRRFADLLGDNRRRVAVLAISSTLSGLTEAGILAVVAQVAASLATGANRVNVSIGPAHVHARLGSVLALGGVLVVVRLALQGPTSYLPARIASSVQARLRGNLFHAFTGASWTAQASDREGQLQELMGGQIAQASQGTVAATTLMTNVAAFAVLLISALVLNPAAAAIVFVLSVGLFAALRPLTGAGSRYARGSSRAQLAQASGVSEATRLAEETHVYGVGAQQRDFVDGLIEQARSVYFRAQLMTRLVPSVYQSMIYIFLVGGLAAIYEFAHTNVASLGAVVLLLVRAAAYGNGLQTSYQVVKQATPFIERVREAEKRYRDSTPPHGRRDLSSIETIAFEDVSYSYADDRPVLEQVTFEVRKGEAIGVVGPSGAGKSTLAQLLLLLRPATTGRYLVNGEAAQEFAEQDWHRFVSYVPQTPHLIHASVAENIKYLRVLPDDVVEEAARSAGIHEDIVSWPNGYDTIVGPRADAVSGGQAQRICLARALAGGPKLLLLDEPTSAVDMRSERLIQDSLLALKGQVTLFVIAHRISTLDMCDRVMVILEGKLNAFEPFTRLREQNAYYRSVLASDADTGTSLHVE
jgi:ABC-type multidrug transport system fused ATPase/permease subunit